MATLVYHNCNRCCAILPTATAAEARLAWSVFAAFFKRRTKVASLSRKSEKRRKVNHQHRMRADSSKAKPEQQLQQQQKRAGEHEPKNQTLKRFFFSFCTKDERKRQRQKQATDTATGQRKRVKREHKYVGSPSCSHTCTGITDRAAK